MKKVRNVLVLLLAALMLSVFVSCAPDLTDSEVKPEFKKVEAEDIVISQFYLAGDNTKLPEGATLTKNEVNSGCKFIVITNRGTKNFDLTGYAVGLRKPGVDPKYTSKVDFPKVSLAPGKSIYCLNSYKGSLGYLYDLFPNFNTLPEINEKSTGVLENDVVWTGAPGYYNGETTVELVKNIVDNGEMDGRHHVYAGWDIVDNVVVDGKEMPAKGTAVIRNEDLTWKSVNWAVKDEIAVFNPEKGSVIHDYSFATMKTEVIDKYCDDDKDTRPTAAKPEKYYSMSPKTMKAFKDEAKKAGYSAYIAGDFSDFFVAKDTWTIKQSTYKDEGKWYFTDYDFALLAAKIDEINKAEKPTFTDETLGKYPRYYEMANVYKNAFMEAAKAREWTATVESDKFSLQISKDVLLVQTKDGWTTAKPESPVKPDTKLETPFAVTEFFMGSGNGKVFGITNVSNQPADLNDYWYSYVQKINFGSMKDTENTMHYWSLPDVKVYPGCTVYVANIGFNNKDLKKNLETDNELTNYSSEKLIKLGVDGEVNTAITEVKDANAIYGGWMTISGWNTISLGKGEMNEANIIKTYDNVCDKKVPQKSNYYVRDINKLQWSEGEPCKKGESGQAKFNTSLLTLKDYIK